MDRLGRSRIAIVLLLALTSGAALFAFAGARRTQSSYPRFLRSVDASDLVVTSAGGYSAANDRVVAAFPEVVSARTYVAFQSYAMDGDRPDPRQDFEAIGTFDGQYYDQDRFTPTSGRLPRRDAPGEVAINRLMADELDYHLGSRIDLGTYDFRTVGPDVFSHPTPPALRRTVTVVGIGFFPDEIHQDEADRTNRLLLTPAFTRTARSLVTYGLQGLVLRRGDADVGAVVRRVGRAFPAGVNGTRETRVDRFHGVQSTRPASVALAIFGVISAVAAIVVSTQALLALVRADQGDQDVLRAIGASPRLIARRALAAPAVVVVAGVGLGVAFAVAASPLMPAGPIRKVTSPHVDVDRTVLGLGGLALALVVMGIVAAGVWLGLPHRRVARSVARPVRARPIDRLGARLTPSAAAGLRMVLGRGGSTSATSAFVVVTGAMVAAAALTTAVTFGGSLTHLVDTPHLYGWNWDAAVLPGNGYDNLAASRVPAALHRDPDVASWSGAYFGVDTIDGVSTPVLGMAVGSDVQPPLIRGRVAEQASEVVLGGATARAIGKDVGDTVSVTETSRTTRLTVVGIATLPTIGQIHVAHTSLGVGAIVAPDLTQGAHRDIQGRARSGLGPNVVFVRFHEGVGPEAARRRLDATVQPLASFAGVVTLPVQRPAEIASSDTPRTLPLLLSGSLCLAALLSLLLVIVGAARRHRRDLALCRTLGFTRRQVTGALAWQATITVLLSLVVANLAAVIPGRRAARLSPAAVLRRG